MSREGRLLVIGDYPINYANGIGETLSNLLADHPDATLFQSHPDHLRPLDGQARGRAVTFTVPRRPEAWPGWASRWYQPILKLRQSAAEDELFSTASALIERERIEAVLSYPVTPWVLFAVVRLRRAFPKVRFVFYVMDDWEGHHTCFGLPFTAKRRAALSEIVETSDARFACSHLMEQDYEQRFHNQWDVLHKGVDAGVPLPAATPLRIDNILYTGAMNMFRFDAVLAFAEGLHRYRARSGHDVTLTLLGPEPDREYATALAPYPFIKTEPWVDNEACQRRMAKADLLYLPLSFERRLDRIANLAMPTKFSEYLASGRPTIFHVPRESEVHALAAQQGLPLTLTTVDADAIAAFFDTLRSGGFDAAAYRNKAAALLAAEFDQLALRRRLREACFTCAS
ncbi:MAG: glycosyltransferase [Cyanobacteria bacterium]|nr:glycosyltransferase [Cyanobacteriota bacterium]